MTQDGDNVTLCQAPRGRTLHAKHPGRAAAVAPASREAPGEGAGSPSPASAGGRARPCGSRGREDAGLVEHEHGKTQLVEGDAERDGACEGAGHGDRPPEPPVGGLPAHEGRRQREGASDEDRKKQAWAFIDALKLHSCLVNIGDVRSLVSHPATTTHSQGTPESNAKAGVSISSIRLSVGIEAVEDIIGDLELGFAAIS